MTKKLYEEALADVKSVRAVAEDNAKRAIIEAVTPRIRDLIERELLGESGMEDDLDQDVLVQPADPANATRVADVGQRLPVVGAPLGGVDPSANAITVPDTQGKVTLDVDALGACPPALEPGVAVEPPQFGAPVGAEDTYEISLESLESLTPIITASKNDAKKFGLQVERFGALINKMKAKAATLSESKDFHDQIDRMISHVEDMYEYVQESINAPAAKNSYEVTLESYYKDLNKLQEPSMKNKKHMNEADVTLKLTGLPDDVDLDSVGVDLITGEDEDAEGGDVTGDDMGDLDVGDDDQGMEGGEQDMGEGLNLSDDTIVEIDEGMLRKEIARMRSLREDAVPSTAGKRPEGKTVDDFGGGSDDGDPLLDHEPTTAGKVGEPLGESDGLDEADADDLDESDDQMDESDDLDETDGLDEMGFGTSGWGGGRGRDKADQGASMDELDGLDQLGNRRKHDEFDADVADGHASPTWDHRHESLTRRLAFETKLQARAKARAAALKTEAVKSRKDAKKMASIRKEYTAVASRFNESTKRSTKISKLLGEVAKKIQNESRSNSGTARPAESSAVQSLRKKLAESNLYNAKLTYTNKLLQNENLSSRQKARVIGQLESAKTVREARLVYESLANLAGPSKTVTENKDRRVLGSSSRTMTPASTPTLNEGFESERWAKLAGIVK